MDYQTWRKSTYSYANHNCVEAADSDDGVLVRDTMDNGNVPVLTFGPEAWRAFTAVLRGN